MLYAILCYDAEDIVTAWSAEKDQATSARLAVVEAKLAAEGRLGAAARLLPTTSATTVRARKEPLVTDGPCAETKQQLLGFYVVECASLDSALATACELARANPGAAAYEVRPLALFHPSGGVPSGRGNC
ncbi:MAG: hypothetical protein JWN44_812 [Myxococcales bacterium]|nr:hypothetical protein [Myxococcales bacterium]